MKGWKLLLDAMMYEVVFNDDRLNKRYREIDHLDGGWLRCASPTVDAVETKHYPPTAIKEVKVVRA